MLVLMSYNVYIISTRISSENFRYALVKNTFFDSSNTFAVIRFSKYTRISNTNEDGS